MIPPPYGSGEWQLFDVVKDPGEAQDLSNRMPDRLDDLRSAWDRYAKDVGVILPEE
jgi:arylsulfatase